MLDIISLTICVPQLRLASVFPPARPRTSAMFCRRLMVRFASSRANLKKGWKERKREAYGYNNISLGSLIKQFYGLDARQATEKHTGHARLTFFKGNLSVSTKKDSLLRSDKIAQCGARLYRNRHFWKKIDVGNSLVRFLLDCRRLWNYHCLFDVTASSIKLKVNFFSLGSVRKVDNCRNFLWWGYLFRITS